MGWPDLGWPDMGWGNPAHCRSRLGSLAVVMLAASLTAGCFQPLYGSHPVVGGGTESVHDKLAAIDVPDIVAPKGQPAARIGVNLRNDLEYELNGGASPKAPIYRLTISVSTIQLMVTVDITTGLPADLVDSVIANYNLTEIATGRTVVSDMTYAHVDYNLPGFTEQRFAKQRAQRDAEDKATQVVADNIRTRLASYFVAGT